MVMLGYLMSIMAAFYNLTTEQELAKKKKKVPELLQRWNVPGDSVGMVVVRSWEEVHLYPLIVLRLHLLSSTSFIQHEEKVRLKPTVKCNNKTNLTLIAFEWQIG